MLVIFNSILFRNITPNLRLWIARHWEKIVNFAVADRNAEARSGFERRDADIMKSVYPRWFLTFRNSRKIHLDVKDCATVDARGYVIILLSVRYFGRNIAGRKDCIYKRGLLRCRPISKGQCEKPRKVGWQQIQIPALFSYNNKRQREDDRGILYIWLTIR